MYRTMSQAFDCEGRMAAQGAPDEAWVTRALEHPFFALPPPKSLDRNDFGFAGATRDASRRRRGDTGGIHGRSDRPASLRRSRRC